MKIDNVEVSFQNFNSRGVVVIMSPEWESTYVALSAIDLKELNKFYTFFVNEIDCGKECIGFHFADATDWEKEHIPENHLECYFEFADKTDILHKITFFKIAVAYAESYIAHYPEVANPEFLALVEQLRLKIASHNFSEKLNSKIATLRDLSTRRPLLARESVELAFLEKIQAADSLEILQSLENDLNNTPTDADLITRLQKYISEKKAFY